MVRSPGPVLSGFGLDGGEVFAHLAVVALGLFGFKHYSIEIFLAGKNEPRLRRKKVLESLKNIRNV